MSEPSLMDDLRDLRANWHDPAYRRGFFVGFIPAFIRSFLIYGIVGLVVGYSLSRMFG